MNASAFTVQTLASRWECSVDVIYDMLRSGKLKGFRVGNSWRIGDREIERYENQEEETR